MDPRPEVVAHDAPDAVGRIVAALQSGGVVVLPTDTVYGLAALPGDAGAIARLFSLKQRAAGVPLAVLCASADQALALAAAPVDPEVRTAAARWWPGPLTLVVPRRADLELHLGEPSTTIGIRVPAHDLLRQVAAVVGPVAATSANRHGQATPATADGVIGELGPGVALVVDGGLLAAGASTVVDTTGEQWRVLREGPIPSADVLPMGDAPPADDR